MGLFLICFARVVRAPRARLHACRIAAPIVVLSLLALTGCTTSLETAGAVVSSTSAPASQKAGASTPDVFGSKAIQTPAVSRLSRAAPTQLASDAASSSGSSAANSRATPAPVGPSEESPDTDFGDRYFGKVTLAAIRGADSEVVDSARFSYGDQIALRIAALKQNPQLPFTMRVFNGVTSTLVAEVRSDVGSAFVVPAESQRGTGYSAAGKWVVRLHSDGQWYQETHMADGTWVVNGPAPVVTSENDVASPHVTRYEMARFGDDGVWYHTGAEEVGRYHLELYADDVLANTFDYTVAGPQLPGTEPTVAPAPTSEPAPSPTDESVPPPPPTPTPVTRTGSTPPRAAAAPAPAPTPAPIATPVPAPKTVYPTIVGGIPAGLDVDSSLGRFFVADAAGLIWSTDAPTGTERPTLGVPINLAAFNAGFPVDLASDSTTNRLFVSARKCPPEPDSGNVPYGCVLVIDVNTATLLKSISLPASPGDLRVDGDIGMLYVAAPERQELFQVNASNGEVLGYLKDMPQVTSLALDLQRHLLYAGHLAGQVSVIDARSGSVMARPSVTQAGLTSVAAARGLGYAVNTATHELAVVDAGGQSINRFVLPQEPAAVVAAEDSGAVYVLTSGSESIIRIDPTDGTELGRVMIASRNGRTSTRPNDIQSLRPRLVIDPVADTVYATQPEAGTLVAAADSAFPPLARAISQPVTSASPSDGDIPEVLRPAEVNSGPLNASQP